MASLKSIKKTAQQTAEAISAALHVHVEISDDNLECVAGTGEFAKLIGTKLQGYIHARVLSSGKACIIENPGYHEFCRPCPFLKNCYATAEICVPIFKGKTPVGVIGLVSLDAEQRDRLILFQDQNVNFLEKMSDLLSSKLKEIELLEKEKFLNNQLETVINFVDQGVIASDEYGNITHINRYAQKVVGEENVIGKRLTSVMPVEKIKNIYLSNQYFKQEKFDLKQKNRHLRVIGDAHPVIVDNKNSGVVLSFRAVSDAVRMSYAANSSLQYGFEDIIGVSRPILEIKEKAKKIAKSDSTVLITGESGTGKEILARAIHANSNRIPEHFITINCGAIPETLLESELFGYEDGAFTGARKGGKLGKFEIANGGTIFLDEIGDMPLHLQVKLLRVLEEKVIERVGGSFSVPIDVRVIAATHRDLEERAQQNLFRWDLYYRLNVIPLHIPPLRERKEDIMMLAEHFLKIYNDKINKKIMHIAKETEDMLLNYDWPGNVRELSNAIEYAVNMESSTALNARNLPPRIRLRATTSQYIEKDNGLKKMERDLIADALAKYGSTTEGKKKVAESLGISLATLYRKLKIYNLS